VEQRHPVSRVRAERLDLLDDVGPPDLVGGRAATESRSRDRERCHETLHRNHDARAGGAARDLR